MVLDPQVYLANLRWFLGLQSLEAVLIVDIRHLLNQEVPIAEGFASQQLVCKRSREQCGECFHLHNWFEVYNFWSTSHSALRLFSLPSKFITICSDMYQVISCYNHHEIFWDTVSWAYSICLPCFIKVSLIAFRLPSIAFVGFGALCGGATWRCATVAQDHATRLAQNRWTGGRDGSKFDGLWEIEKVWKFEG